jgi:hypothetical protein
MRYNVLGDASWYLSAYPESPADISVSKARQLVTARTIWGQSFDGSANVSGNPEYNYGGHLLFYNSAGSLQSAVYADNTLYLGMGYTNSSTIVMGGAVHLRYGSGTDGLVVNNQGNVLIGTTTDNGAKLQVEGYVSISNNNGIYFKDNGGTIRSQLYVDPNNHTTIAYGAMETGGYTAIYGTYLRFLTSASDERMRITNSGNVLIGTTSDIGYKVQVAGNLYASDQIVNDTTMATWAAYYLRFNGATTCGLYADSHINAQDLSRLWLFNGGGNLALYGNTIQLHSSATISGNLTVTGDIVASGEVISNRRASASDARLKDNITTLTAVNCLNIARQLRPTKWNWKTDGKHSFGFIAQDVNNILPCAVTAIKDAELGERLNLQYDQLIAIAIGGVQGVDDKVTRLENEVQDFKKEVKVLKEKLQKYELRYGYN